MLNLNERDPKDAADIFIKYLSHTRIATGAALADARREYSSKQSRSLARATLSVAWRDLVYRGDELLIELLSDAVESKVGTRPDINDVAIFLTTLNQQHATTTNAYTTSLPYTAPTSCSINSSNEATVCGKLLRYRNGNHALVVVLNELERLFPGFLQKCSTHPKMRGRKRVYIARRKEELYPDRPDLQDYYENLDGGFLVQTNLSNISKISLLRNAASIAGKSFGPGMDVDVSFV